MGKIIKIQSVFAIILSLKQLLVMAGLISITLLFYFTRQSPMPDSTFNIGQTLALQGRGNIPACNPCHGDDGEGDFSTGIPRLAGLNGQYLHKQLDDFARDPLQTRVALEPIARDYTKTPRTYSDLTVFTPGTRHHTQMNNIARLLTDNDRKNLAHYFSRLPYTATPTPYDFETLERGEDLALRGKPEYGLPACVACHGPKGEGFGDLFPPLAGQPPQYIINQINHWQRGKRDNDHLALMRSVAEKLTDGDKINVAAYYNNQSYTVNTKEP